MQSRWRVELPQVFVIVAMFVASAVSWAGAPDKIPMHWATSGEIDSYGGKFEGLLAIPFLALAVYLLLRFLPEIDPGRANYPRFRGAYATLRISILVFIGGVHAMILYTAFGGSVAVERLVPFAVGVLLAVAGGLMGKIRPNWFVGIRTPWTLSSKRAWVQTHRLGGFLFLGMGLAFIATGLFRLQLVGAIVLPLMILVVVVLVAYSYVVWRTDPEKIHPAGTQPSDDA